MLKGTYGQMIANLKVFCYNLNLKGFFKILDKNAFKCEGSMEPISSGSLIVSIIIMVRFLN